MASLLSGCKLITKAGASAPSNALDGKVVLLYFSASWCGPCHRFTPVLADFYDEVRGSGGNIEIVYVPGDRSRDEMMKYFKDLHGDWLALDMSDGAVIQDLNERYQVRGIPALVAIQADGTVIDAGCRDKVQSHGPASFDAWRRAWKPPAFGGTAYQLGGGSGVSRLVSGAPASTNPNLSSRSPDYDEDAALAAALAASAQAVDNGDTLTRTTSPGAVLARARSDEERKRAQEARLLHAAESADQAASDAELRATAAETQLIKIDRAVSRLNQENSAAVAKTAIELLLKITAAIQKNPREPKYRKLRKDNKKISTQVLAARGALGLLSAVGFASTDDGFLVMSEESVNGSLIEHSIATLQAAAAGREAGQFAAAKAAREAHLAKLRSDAREAKAARDRMRRMVAGDSEARRDPNWSAKAFEKGGQAVTRFEDIGVDLNSAGG